MRPIRQTRQLDTADADGVSAAESLLAAGDLTIGGAFASGGVATLDAQRQVLLTSGENLSAVTFTITGTDEQGRVITEDVTGPNAGTAVSVLDYMTVTQIAASAAFGVVATGVLTLAANAVADETVTIGTQVYTWKAAPSAANEVDIGGSASVSIDNLIAAINNDAGEGTLYGTGTTANTDASAAAGAGDTMDLTSLIAGTAGNAVATTETMTQGSFGAVVLENGSDALTVGTNGVGGSIPIPIDQYQSPTNIGIGLDITGTVNVDVEHTFDDVFDGNASAIRTWYDHDTLAAETADVDGNYAFPPTAIRLRTNSGDGTCVMSVIQSGAIG